MSPVGIKLGHTDKRTGATKWKIKRVREKLLLRRKMHINSEMLEVVIRVHLRLKESMKKMASYLAGPFSACLWMYVPLSTACVLPQYTLYNVCMCWLVGVTSGFHEGPGRLRAAKYSTEGIRGNLLIREKRLNLRSCNCKWRWGLSEGLSASLQG